MLEPSKFARWSLGLGRTCTSPASVQYILPSVQVQGDTDGCLQSSDEGFYVGTIQARTVDFRPSLRPSSISFPRPGPRRYRQVPHFILG